VEQRDVVQIVREHRSDQTAKVSNQNEESRISDKTLVVVTLPGPIATDGKENLKRNHVPLSNEFHRTRTSATYLPT